MENRPDLAFEHAKAYEMKSGGCPQCTIAGIFDALGIRNDDVFKAATGLADGVGLTGNGHCGALSGGCLVIGLLYGRDMQDFGKIGKLLKANQLSKQLHDWFVAEYGSARCNEVQTAQVGRFYNLYDPEEFKAGLEAGLLDKCSTLVGAVARKTTQIILAEQAAGAE